jgi:hypothetical protein
MNQVNDTFWLLVEKTIRHSVMPIENGIRVSSQDIGQRYWASAIYLCQITRIILKATIERKNHISENFSSPMNTPLASFIRKAKAIH